MTRMSGPDGFVKQTDIKSQSGKVRYTAGKDGIYNVNNPAHVKALKESGFTEALIPGQASSTAGLGYTCSQCGFGSWFIKCSRCGHEITDIHRDGEIENGSSNSD